jgi:archaellum biogenesis protein FlaJ (TadC family)
MKLTVVLLLLLLVAIVYAANTENANKKTPPVKQEPSWLEKLLFLGGVISIVVALVSTHAPAARNRWPVAMVNVPPVGNVRI